MKIIQPNCRLQFTADDIDFILSVLGDKAGRAESLVKLLADEDTRDLILDDEALYRALLEQTGCLRVSNHFYFYILVRQVLKRSGIADRTVADYVAELLSEFSSTERTRGPWAGTRQPCEYLVDMLAALQEADERTRFLIHAHIGNHTLFFSGVFLQRIHHRAETRGFPALSYYEELGRNNFRVASHHRLARKHNLASIFETLSERFQTTRQALNDLSERLISLGDSDYSFLRA